MRNKYKDDHAKQYKKRNSQEAWTFLFCLLYSDNKLHIYSYNQLQVILDYFENDTPLTEIDSQLCSLFAGYFKAGEAKEVLAFLGAEPFSKDLWRVAKTLDWRKAHKGSKLVSQGVEINNGNIIKMGRLKMRLMSMRLQDQNEQIKSKEPVDLPKVPSLSYEDGPVDLKDVSIAMSDQSEEIPPWRFCLSNVMDDKNNPLINPWNCKGTQGLLHLDWLKAWMESGRNHKVFSQYSEMYTWKTLNCELCKSPYPFKVWFGGKTESLLDYKLPDGEYMAFETFLKEGSDKATSKSVYILRIPLIRNYRVGRSHDVEFHIEDISVSRFHGEIQVTKDKVFMQDYKSKYGTQILIKREQVLDQNDCTKNMFQVGRAWMMASFVKKSKVGFFPCCFSAPKATNSIERKNSKLNNSAKRQDTHGNMLDSQLFDKLEQDIEDLQKDRDSVFYLDDDFYNKLIGMYINKDEKRPNKRSIEVYENRETIDDVWGGEYKQEESDNSPDSSSNNNSDDSDDDSARSENSQESDSMGINEQSAEGIGIENQKSNMLSKQESMVRAIPK